MMLTTQLTKVNENLSKKFVEHREIECLIDEYKIAFEHLLKGSESLLANMRKSIEQIAPHLLDPSETGSMTSRRTRSSRHSHPSEAGSITRVDLSRAGVLQPNTIVTESGSEVKGEITRSDSDKK